MSEEFPAQKLLQEFDAKGGRLELLAVQVPAEENREIRDEIVMLAGESGVSFLNIESDTIRAEISSGQSSTRPGATEEMVRKFEDAGWKWG
jgi:hypothetical protein